MCKTHCKQGHAFTPENTRATRRQRFCRTCARERVKQFRERHPESVRKNYENRRIQVLAQATQWNKDNKERRRKQPCQSAAAQRRYKYGLASETYDRLYAEQGGMCKLFCSRRIGCVDHCHDFNVFRGLLCKQCNAALGLLKHDPELLIRASEYLKAFIRRRQ